MKEHTFKSILRSLSLSLPLLGAATANANVSVPLFVEADGKIKQVDYKDDNVGITLQGWRDADYVHGSTDATAGNEPIAHLVTENRPNALKIRNLRVREQLRFVIKNNDPVRPLELRTFNFDYSRVHAKSPSRVSVIYTGGDLGDRKVIGRVTDDTLVRSAKLRVGDFDDFSLSIKDALPSSVLMPGQEAWFRVVPNSNRDKDITGAGIIDNFGVYGAFVSQSAADYSFEISSKNATRTVSPLLMGMHQVYSSSEDRIYDDYAVIIEDQFETMADWVKRAGITTSRFPGGSVLKIWDWENPSGDKNSDIWDPSWDPSKRVDDSLWMSLDEYLDFVDRSGITPHFGANSYSGKVYNREQDGIDRAVRMVQYVKDRGYGGAIWYIGNEEHHGAPPANAVVFAKYAKAMKAVDPDIKTIWNVNSIEESRFKNFLQNDDGMADGVETHAKWSGSLDEWQNQYPLVQKQNGQVVRTWRSVADQYRQWAADVGRPDLMITNNEWGLEGGSPSLKFPGMDTYQMGLVASEYLMEMIIGNWDMSCFWSVVQGRFSGLVNRRYGLDKQGIIMNPVGQSLQVLTSSAGAEFLHTIENQEGTVHGFAVKKNGTVIAYLLNKSGEDATIEFTLKDDNFAAAKARQTAQNAEGFGLINAFDVTKTGDSFFVDTTAFSLTEVVFEN